MTLESERSGRREHQDHHGKENDRDRRRSGSRPAHGSDNGPIDFVPDRHDFDRAKTKNRRKEYSHLYVPLDSPQSERKWALNMRSGKCDDNPRHQEDREKTAKGNRAAVRELNRNGVAHRDFAYSTASNGHWRSDQRYANDDHLCREPDSCKEGPRWRYT